MNRLCEALAHVIVGAVWLADRIADPVVCRFAYVTGDDDEDLY